MEEKFKKMEEKFEKWRGEYAKLSDEGRDLIVKYIRANGGSVDVSSCDYSATYGFGPHIFSSLYKEIRLYDDHIVVVDGVEHDVAEIVAELEDEYTMYEDELSMVHICDIIMMFQDIQDERKN